MNFLKRSGLFRLGLRADKSDESYRTTGDLVPVKNAMR